MIAKLSPKNRLKGCDSSRARGQRLTVFLPGLLWIAEMPEHHSSPGAADDPQVSSIMEGQPAVLPSIVESNPPLHMSADRGQFPKIVERRSQSEMTPEQQGCVLLALGQTEELLSHFTRRLDVSTRQVKSPQPCQGRGELARVIDLLTQRSCPSIGPPNLRCTVTSKSDHTTLAHWQLAQASSRGVLGSSSVRIPCGLI
jgi:hypothetical protein